MKRFALLALLALAACNTTQPRVEIRTVEVKVPVPVACVIDVADPIYSDSNEALTTAPDLFERVKLLLAGREERDAHDAVERAARSGCSGEVLRPPRPG